MGLNYPEHFLLTTIVILTDPSGDQGLELMSRPSILFLDEPTSGLDSSSALLVMSSLKNLVHTQGMTVLSVIHQVCDSFFFCFSCRRASCCNLVYLTPLFYRFRLPSGYKPRKAIFDSVRFISYFYVVFGFPVELTFIAIVLYSFSLIP